LIKVNIDEDPRNYGNITTGDGDRIFSIYDDATKNYLAGKHKHLTSIFLAHEVKKLCFHSKTVLLV
jgi:hypothetical protein